MNKSYAPLGNSQELTTLRIPQQREDCLVGMQGNAQNGMGVLASTRLPLGLEMMEYG